MKMNIPTDPQVSRKIKRYNEANPSMKRTNVLRILLLLSSLVLGGIVVFLVVYFVTRTSPTVLPPSVQTIPDELFSSYLQMDKSMYAWSHSSDSKIAGSPAYSSLLGNRDNAFDYLLNFSNRHTIGAIYLYGGCAQWDSDSWAQGTLPYSSSLENAIRKARLKGYEVNLVAYLNDDPNNMTNYASIKNFAAAAVALNNRMGSQGFKSVSLKIVPTEPEAYAYALETYKLATSILRPVNIALEGMVLPDVALSTWTFRPELYVGLEVTSDILGLINSGGTLTYGRALGAILDTVHVVAQDTGEYALIEQWEEVLKLFKEIRPQFDTSKSGLHEQIYQDPASFLRSLPQLAVLCKTYESSGHTCGAPSISSYLDYHTGLYILEPVQSDSRYLVDLYYNGGRSA